MALVSQVTRQPPTFSVFVSKGHQEKAYVERSPAARKRTECSKKSSWQRREKGSVLCSNPGFLTTELALPFG